MRWIHLAHLYQPVNTDGYIIEEATEKAYLRLIRAIEEHPDVHITLNITGCLFSRWEDLGYGWVAQRIGKLVKEKRVELMGSAAYHAFLPLTPIEEVEKQIKENEAILKKYLGKYYKKPTGFFFPEMAYSRDVAKLVKKLGYTWTVLDEITLKGKFNNHRFDKIYRDEYSGLDIVFRSRHHSNCYIPDSLLKRMKEKDYSSDELYITAADAELFGLRHEDPTGEFEKLLSSKKLNTQTIPEFIKSVKDEPVLAKPLPSHWNSRESELKNKNPYSLWKDKNNKLQMKLWKLFEMSYRAVEKNKRDKHYGYARWHLVRGMASCTFWWASAKDFRVFGPISWSPDEIERGINEFVRAVRSLDSLKTKSIKIKVEKLSHNIKHEIWERHWKKYWKK